MANIFSVAAPVLVNFFRLTGHTAQCRLFDTVRITTCCKDVANKSASFQIQMPPTHEWNLLSRDSPLYVDASTSVHYSSDPQTFCSRAPVNA